MAITHLNDDHFTDAEINVINDYWNNILQVLNNKTRNLSPEERQRFGSVSEQNKLVVQKVLDYGNHHVHLRSPEVNYDELAADWKDRNFLAALISKLEEGMRIADNVRITHDWDAYQAARIDYRHAEYKAGTDPGAGWEGKYNELRQFFATNPTGRPVDGEKPAPDASGPEA